MNSFFSHSNVFVSTLSSLSQSWTKLSAIKTILCSQLPSFHHPRNPGLNPPTSTQQRQCGLWASLLQHCSTAAAPLMTSFLPSAAVPASPAQPSPAQLAAGSCTLAPGSSQPAAAPAPLQHCSSPAAPTHWCQLHNLNIGQWAPHGAHPLIWSPIFPTNIAPLLELETKVKKKVREG